MNLTLIKQIEDAKEVLSELNKQLEERSAKIELQKHQDAFADFTDHFRKGGFDVSDDDAAKFRGAQHRALVAKMQDDIISTRNESARRNQNYFSNVGKSNCEAKQRRA